MTNYRIFKNEHGSYSFEPSDWTGDTFSKEYANYTEALNDCLTWHWAEFGEELSLEDVELEKGIL